MANKHLTRTRQFAVFVTAITLALTAQLVQAHEPQPGGEPIATATPAPALPTMAAPNTAPQAAPAASVQQVQAVALDKSTRPTRFSAEVMRASGIVVVEPVKHLDPAMGHTMTATTPGSVVVKSDGGAFVHYPSEPPPFVRKALPKGASTQSIAPPLPFTNPNLCANNAMKIRVFLTMLNRPAWASSPDYATLTNLGAHANWTRSILENGSKWLGTGQQSLCFEFVDWRILNVDMPQLAPGKADLGWLMHYTPGWLNGIPYRDVCNEVAASPDPVQHWVMTDFESNVPEWMVNGPYFSSGNVSVLNMPDCGKTYSIFGFHNAYKVNGVYYHGGWSNDPHMWGHYWEWYMSKSDDFGYRRVACEFANWSAAGAGGLYDTVGSSVPNLATRTIVKTGCQDAPGIPLKGWPHLTGRAGTLNEVGIGDIHYPCTQLWWNDTALSPDPNAYVYNNTSPQFGRPNNWWIPGSPAYNCSSTNWGSTAEGWYTFWFQRQPGAGATATDRNGIGFNISSHHYGVWALIWIGI